MLVSGSVRPCRVWQNNVCELDVLLKLMFQGLEELYLKQVVCGLPLSQSHILHKPLFYSLLGA